MSAPVEPVGWPPPVVGTPDDDRAVEPDAPRSRA